ncbi:hypothetical protein OAB59_03285 [Pelagibacteraceae bacterium]|nr:hypothetical protein [Pelagibacteraceae bacterium]
MFQINWKLKGLLYKVFGIFNSQNFYYLVQKYITQRSKIEINEINKAWTYHANSIKEKNIKSLLEVGAGKSLEQNIYIAYVFKSAIKQTAIDINLMIDFDLVNEASEQISRILGEKYKGKINNLNELKAIYNINYKAPCVLESLKNSKDKFDICISTTTLEHFTTKDLKNYLSDLKDILTNTILISAVIDYSDHYSHTDKRINALNFLSYSEKEWEKYNNKYLFQNRLRHQNYKEIFEKNGYKIKEISEGPVLELPKKICDEFDAKNKETYMLWAYFLIEIK